MHTSIIRLTLILLLAPWITAFACESDTLASQDGIPPLKELAAFPIGVAVPADPWPNSLLDSPERQAVVNRHFNSLTAENNMKMAYIRPAPGVFSFPHADALAAYARQHGMVLHGHALIWHTQAPEWMNEMEGSPQEFERVLRRHVRTVAAHFAGDVVSWDVVNEAFTDEEPSTYRDTIWYRNLGERYIEQAFRWAREVDPNADLYYNDYDISGAIGPHKLQRILEMADDFLARGVPLDGIGFQMHIDTETPALEDIRWAFAQVVERGLKVRISELDVSVNQDQQLKALDSGTAERQSRRYYDVVKSYKDVVPPALRGGITLWGITDDDSWIPGFKERPDWPLLFDDAYRAKPALAGFAGGLQSR